MSADPAMGEYLGSNPDELKGQGGVFNPINLQTYHYGGNNPLKYTDPSGRDIDKGPDYWEERERERKQEEYNRQHAGTVGTPDPPEPVSSSQGMSDEDIIVMIGLLLAAAIAVFGPEVAAAVAVRGLTKMILKSTKLMDIAKELGMKPKELAALAVYLLQKGIDLYKYFASRLKEDENKMLREDNQKKDEQISDLEEQLGSEKDRADSEKDRADRLQEELDRERAKNSDVV